MREKSERFEALSYCVRWFYVLLYCLYAARRALSRAERIEVMGDFACISRGERASAVLIKARNMALRR